MAATDDVSRGRKKLKRCPPGSAGRYVALYDLAKALYGRFLKEDEIDDLNESITFYHDSLELRPVENKKGDRSNLLNNLAVCLYFRYDKLGAVDDLEEAIALGREALALRPPGHPVHGMSLNNLGVHLSTRFEKQAEICDLEEAIELLRAGLELRPPGHQWRFESLRQLILCLSSRYERQGGVDDLEELVTLRRAELDLYPRGHSHHVASLHNLACDLRRRYAKTAAISDLEESIELHRTALELRPSGHRDRSSTLVELTLCLSTRYDKLGMVADLDEAVEFGRAALKLLTRRHPSRGESLHNLACNLRKRFMKQAAMQDLEEAIELLRPASELRPVGHPDRSSSLHELALCLSHRHDKYRVAEDLEEAVTLGREALKLCPPRHPDRGLLLNNLACDLWKEFQYLRQAAAVVRPSSRADLASAYFELSQHLWDCFQKQASLIDLDDAIYLATCALDLRSPPEDDSVAAWVERLLKGENLYSPVVLDEAMDSLHALANYHRARFQSQHEMVDLNEAITYYRHILRFHLTGRPSRASFLHDLAQCLADRFRQRTTTADLDDAITLEQEALHLLDREDPEYDASRRCLIDCLKTKFSSQVDVTSSDVSGVIHLDVEQVIRDVVFETLKNMPTRLLHTPTGILCNRDEQVSRFMKSKLYKRLVYLCATYDWHQQVDRIRADISRDFQYVTLSHRWGEGEPSLRDVEGHTIYGMSIRGGFGKLQTFCRVALEWNYLWAWSDTCCIDKHSSAEVQETIGSMFAWYRQSALTIAYLSDVTDIGSLGSSEWLRRGWTLQELLAPERVVFYTKTWSLYKNITSLNHKMDVVVLEEVEGVTGIERRFLKKFSPGLDDAHLRLQWASPRTTTRAEDIAYSLFGIFNVHLPIMYGESAENALGRLLAEIVSQSGDISVLDWVGEPSPFHSCFPAYITSYSKLSTPPHPLNTEEQPLATGEGLSSFEVQRNVSGSLTTAPAVQPRTLDTYASSDVYDFHSLAKVPLARFFGRLLTLPCIAYHVTSVQPKGADPSKPSHTYNILASGLNPLEIALPGKLDDVTRSRGVLYLVRPWHSKLLGPFADLDAVTEEQLVSALWTPFNALLLTQLPHNEYKRIASSTLMTAYPVDRASVLNGGIRMFNIV